MLKTSRLPHGASVRSSWRRQLPLFAKLLGVVSVVGYFFWNVTTIATVVQSGAPTLRSEVPLAVAQGVRDAFSTILAARDSEEAWSFGLQTHQKESGCDFSAAVALFKPEELELNCANMDQLE
ncbi:TKL protein kinase, partial [Phytophthora palmivora]